jgi:hypothetical protein
LDDWLNTWLQDGKLDECKKQKDLYIDRYKFKCFKCKTTFIVKLERNEYITNYTVTCPKCGAQGKQDFIHSFSN